MPAPLIRRLRAGLAAAAWAVAGLAQAQGAPFVCDATAYSIATGQLAAAAYSTTTGLVSAEAPIGTSWASATAPALNSLGYNYADNFLYAVARTSAGTGTQQLVRIGSAGAGAAVVVADITGLDPASPHLLTAAAVIVETAGGPRFYIAGENGVAPFSTQLYEINLSTGAATTIGPPIPYRVFDIAVRPTDGRVLFVASSQAAPDFTIHEWNTTTGATTPYATYTGPAPSNAGGIVFSRDGRFMLIRDLDNLNWLTIDMATATSSIGAAVPATPEHDAASCAPQTTNLALAKLNPPALVVGVAASYTMTVSNGAGALTSPATLTVRDKLPPNFAYNGAAPGAGATAASCAASGTLAAGLDLLCTITTPAGLAAGGSASFTISVTPQAAAAGVAAVNRAAVDPGGGTPPPGAPGACVANGVQAGCAVTPPLTPAAAADMGVAHGASTPTVVRPGQTFAALTLSCTNVAGAATATAATCVPTVSVGAISNVACTPASGSDVAAGGSIACSYDYLAPGTQGGADEPTVAVTFTGTTGATNDGNAANNIATVAATMVDAISESDTRPGGSLAQTSNVAANDQYPVGSVFSLLPGGTCANAGVAASGVATYDVAAAGSCTVLYQVCAPAPNGGTCDLATLTVTGASADLSPAFVGIPAIGAPGAAVAGSLVCTNAGPAAAINASCAAGAVDSGGAPVAVTLGACVASAGSAASLPAGASLSCPLGFTMPGVAGGTDTPQTAVVLIGTTGAANDSNGGTGTGGNNSTTANLALIDAVDDAVGAPAGVAGLSSSVAGNDQVPVGSTFALRAGSSCAAASVSGAGTAGYTSPAAGSCTVNYQVCAPAPLAATCDTATLTVTAVPTVADMTAGFSGMPPASGPGSLVAGTLSCTNIAAAAATAATCAATAQDSSGAPVAVTVGACVASAGSAANLPPGASLNCPVSYLTPGTAGGSDTAPVSVTLSGSTAATNDANAANNTTTLAVAIIDALDDTLTLPYGGSGSVTLTANDTLGAVAALPGAGGNASVALTLVEPLPAGMTFSNATAVLTVGPTTPPGTYTINYQLCVAPAVAPPRCDTARTTVTVLGKIDVVKSAGVPLQSAPTAYEVPYAVRVGNAGSAGSIVYNVQADDNLALAFPGATSLAVKPGSTSVSASGGASCSANPAYNGTSDTRLLAGTDDLAGGQNCLVRFTVVLGYPVGGVPAGTLVNSVHASGVPDNGTPNPGYAYPGGIPTPPPAASTTDTSSAGVAPTGGTPAGTPPPAPPLPGTPGGDTPTPTPVNLAPQRIGVAKRVAGIVPDGNTAYTVTYELVVANTGTTTATNVQVADDWAATFPPPAIVTDVAGLTVVSRGGGASAAQCAPNPAFGVANGNLLTGQTSLEAGQSCVLRFAVGFRPNGAVGPFNNTAIATSHAGPAPTPGAAPPGPPLTTDRSDSGTDPAGTNPGAPGDTGGSDDPTPLALPGLITGSVWFDGGTAGGNRVRDAAESGLAGYVAELVYPPGARVGGVDVGGQPVTQIGGAPVRAVTDANGNYTLAGAPAGQYQLRFRTPSVGGAAGAVIGIPVNGEQNNPQANSRLDLPTRTLIVTLLPGGLLAQQSLPVDPGGVVYDSLSRQPIGGARVELLGGGTPLPAACLLPGQQGQLTPAGGPTAGAYRFDLFAGADPACPAAVTSYTIRVSGPPGYGNAPSPGIPPGPPLPSQPGATYLVVPQPTAPAAGDPTTYHLEIALGAASAFVIHNHVPLDPNAVAELVLTKTADRTQAGIGDSVLYRVRVRNTNPVAAPNVRVIDTLPLGFTMIPGSASLQLAGAGPVAIADTAITGFPGPRLGFTIGLMAAQSEATLVYRVRVGLGADRGTGVNSAYVEAGTTRSVSVHAAVKVAGGVFAAEACVIGKVWVDCNHNRLQDRGEPGIPGVRLYLEDGTNLTTDENGQYSLCGLRPITHVLKVDPQSMPVGARLGITSSRNMGDPESLFLDLKRGELHRADFREQSCFPKVIEQVQQRRKLGPVHVPIKQTGKDEPWGIQFDSKEHPLERTPAVGGAR